MNQEIIPYYNGTSARPMQVRVLVFNGLINLYSAGEDVFICSFPLKGASVLKVGDSYFLYLDGSGTAYLEFSEKTPTLDSLQQDIGYANKSFVNKLMQQRILVLIAIMLGLIVGLYVLIIALIPAIGAAMITRDTEIEIGKRLREITLSEERMIGSKVDSIGTLRLQAFADELQLSNEYPINVTLVESKVINAYAMPGGQIVVYAGMLDKIDSAHVLAALLAHEATHVNQRHTLRSLLRSAAHGLIASIIFGDATGVTATLVGQTETLRGLEYSRSLEKEADRLGMQLMIDNEVDVTGMNKLMQLLEAEGDVPESLSFLSSHPLTKERIKASDAFIKENKQNVGTPTRLNNLFDKLKQKKK